MGFGMGIGFGMRLYEVIETPKKQADITNFYEEKNISVKDSFNNSPPDFNEAMKFEIDDNRDVTTVECPIDILNYAGQPESSYDIVQHLKNANCATVEPELPSVSDKEVFQGEEQIVVKDSQESGKLRSNVFECYSCLSTYQSRSAINKHHRDKIDCRLRICKEPHDHEYQMRKFSCYMEAKAYYITLGVFHTNGRAGHRAFCGYCKNRKRLGCTAQWGLKNNGMGEFVFTGCLKHVDNCLGKDGKPSKKGRKPRGIRKKRVKAQNFLCDRCDYKGTSPSCLKSHIKSVHDKIKDNVCPHCGYACSHKKVLDNHINSVHLKMKNFVCEECGSTFFKNAGLQLHRETVHLNKRRYKCEQCDKAFNAKRSLSLHIKIVHLKIKYACQQCGYAASTNGNLRKHRIAVHKTLIWESMEDEPG